MERKARRSQPVQAVKATPFNPACQQSLPKSHGHFSPKAAEAFSLSLHVRVPFPAALAILMEEASAPRSPSLAPAPSAFSAPDRAELVHATSTCHPRPLPGTQFPSLLQSRLLPPRPGRAPRIPATWPACSARRRFLCPAPLPAGRRGLGASERGGVANGRPAYSGLSPARPPIAAGGGGNIVEWSLDAAAAAGWSGAAAGAARVFREGGVRRRRRRRLRVGGG